VEQPVLRLGLLGFADPAGLRLQAWAAQVHEGWPQWRSCDPHLADAWMINGASVDVLGRDEVVIRHPFGSGERLTLNRAEVDRPLAFATPLPEGFASAEFFEADDELSVRQRLQRFEAWLRPLRSQFALGAEVVKRNGLYKGVVHIVHEGKLLAVIDFERWQAGLLIPARPVDLAMAEWAQRPGLSREIPSSFIRLPLHRVMWTYAVRTRLDVLPERYREKTVYLRRVPQVPARWFDEVHLLLMRELLVTPTCFDRLRERTGVEASELAHHLAVLYHAGGLTTDADSARRAEPAARRAMTALQFDQGDHESDLRSRVGLTEQMPPSSILREAPHSPLRVSTASVAPGDTSPPSTLRS
jgi:DNA-binding transcriptional ArsR family regulator